MHGKPTFKRYLFILLALFLMFQLAQSTLVSVDFLDDNNSEPFSVFSNNVIHTGIYLLNNENRKPAFNSYLDELNDSFLDCLFFVHISQSKYLCFSIQSDIRKEIIQTIPNYFHGSKYKDFTLVI